MNTATQTLAPVTLAKTTDRYHVTGPTPCTHDGCGAPRWAVRKPSGDITLMSGTESVMHDLAAKLNERFGL